MRHHYFKPRWLAWVAIVVLLLLDAGAVWIWWSRHAVPPPTKAEVVGIFQAHRQEFTQLVGDVRAEAERLASEGAATQLSVRMANHLQLKYHDLRITDLHWRGSGDGRVFIYLVREPKGPGFPAGTRLASGLMYQGLVDPALRRKDTSYSELGLSGSRRCYEALETPDWFFTELVQVPPEKPVTDGK